MEHRSLEINVISAKDLKKVNLFSKMQAYAVVSISGEPRANQQQRTAVDRSGNASPAWNFPVKFTVDESAARSNRLGVTFRIRCQRTLGDKDIGEVHVPLSELIGSIEDGKLQFLTYQVRKPSGRPKGELNFSYKWGEKIVGAAPPAMEVNKAQEPVTAYPAQVGSSSAYPPPPTGYAYQPPAGYPSASAAGYGYPPPPQYGAYPQQPPPPGYGYPPPQPGYGYPPVQQPQQPPKKNKMGLGLGAGLLGGALGGLLIGEVISDGFGGGCGGGGCGGGCGGG
ncbi:protein SRC2-like [Rhododendron vialii]|uniref:protein SRC2-like n=1 Tax=Rhododendron vialii TaxID=182163 RepID=UPI00265DB079|nr:protein SRC2-like [Rhododendron vialii]